MMGTIDFADARQNGAYLVGETDLDTLDAAAHAEGHLVRRISLGGCHGKDDLLQRIATSFAFPETFGANWDALVDCLGDLEWLPDTGGYAWLFDHAEDFSAASQGDFDMLCDVLDDACRRWKERGTPCFAFLALPDDAFSTR
ncbi:MAG TPA: barstar family protein [Rhodanobacteraceae bacterium]|jgi:RNAse (barnase) inhibitor barstar|nr:barstar family protein [Rhodanobacteraceae bacterium]